MASENKAGYVSCPYCLQMAENLQNLCPACMGSKIVAKNESLTDEVGCTLRPHWLPPAVGTPRLVYIGSADPAVAHPLWYEALKDSPSKNELFKTFELSYALTMYTRATGLPVALVGQAPGPLRFPLIGLPAKKLWQDGIRPAAASTKFWVTVGVCKKTLGLMKQNAVPPYKDELVRWSTWWPKMPLVGVYRKNGDKHERAVALARASHPFVLSFDCWRSNNAQLKQHTSIRTYKVHFAGESSSYTVRPVTSCPIESIDEELLQALGIPDSHGEFTLVFSVVSWADQVKSCMLDDAIVPGSHIQNPLLASRLHWALTPSTKTSTLSQIVIPNETVDGVFILGRTYTDEENTGRQLVTSLLQKPRTSPAYVGASHGAGDSVRSGFIRSSIKRSGGYARDDDECYAWAFGSGGHYESKASSSVKGKKAVLQGTLDVSARSKAELPWEE